MSGLTWEEIKAACEAVGWEWKAEVVTGEILPGAAAVGSGSYRFASWLPDEWESDALALLEAWIALGRDREVQIFLRTRRAGMILIPDEGIEESVASDDEPEFETAAVRAVNAWAESRGRKTP